MTYLSDDAQLSRRKKALQKPAALHTPFRRTAVVNDLSQDDETIDESNPLPEVEFILIGARRSVHDKRTPARALAPQPLP